MEGFTGDLFATKGVEYLLVITYLVLLVSCWRFVFPAQRPREEQKHRELPKGVLLHQGHAWAEPEAGDLVRVGIDDVAQQLMPERCHVILPHVGAHLHEGMPGWQIQVDGHVVSMLSPVEGEVVAINTDVLHEPAIIHLDPYQRGWLLEVKVPSARAVRHNLLSGELALLCLAAAEQRLEAMPREDWPLAASDLLLAGDDRELAVQA